MTAKEIPVCGLAAVQAVFDRDPEAIKRLYFDQPTSRRLAKLSSHLARNKRIYRVVTPQELEKLGGTVHHGGVVAVIEAQPLPAPGAADIARWASRQSPVLLLDRVGNPHNLGAIARSAAFFGVEHLVLAGHPQQALPSEAAHRVAEGGMQHVTLWRAPVLADFCRQLQPAFEVVGAAVGPGSRPVQQWLAGRRRAERVPPVALVLGNEEEGLSPEVASACSARVILPGYGERVESLNVSVAAAILIWELWGRAARPGSPRV